MKTGDSITVFERSVQFSQTAQRFLPGGVSSGFRLVDRPLFCQRAQGAKLYDADGNESVDYMLGMGPVILGHAFPSVTSAVADSLERGQLYAGQHDIELQLAEELCKIIPCAERIRFSQTGSEVVQAALRLARAATSRPKIVKFEGHYHGWFDNIFVSFNPDPAIAGPADCPYTIPHSLGQNPNAYERDLLILPWNNIDIFEQAIRERASEIAGVIMEPIMCNSGVILPKPGYLDRVRKLCSEHGIVLIFDEIITGFRVGLKGAQGLLSVTPDLATFGKALANGFPISCLVGRSEIMNLLADNSVVHAGTFNSNVPSCVAALATIKELQNTHSDHYTRISDLGSHLIKQMQKLAQEKNQRILVQGLGAVFNTCFTEQTEVVDYRSYSLSDSETQTKFINLLIENGVRIPSRGTWFLSSSHTEEDVARTLAAVETVFKALP